MALENKYGKSAVDATRRNALPPYLDELLGGSGGFLPISGGTLTGELRAPYITMLKQDSSNEGGEIRLQAASTTWPDAYLDSNQKFFRIHDGSVEILKLNLQDSAKTLTIPRGSVWAGDGSSPTAEIDCGVDSSAGSLFFYSSPTSGNRGIWVGAHGTGAAKNVMYIDTNNNTTIYTHRINGQILKGGYSSSWWNGRDSATLRLDTINSGFYSPVISIKATSSSWEISAYNYTGYENRLLFCNVTDSNYSSKTNQARRYYLDGGTDNNTYKIWNSGNMTYSLSGTTLTITTS